MLGLAFYHYKGLIYKCLTPFNILMDDYGNAVLCDYGCGRLPFKNENYIKENYYQYLAPEFL